jgi:hypothetical protein
MIGGGRQRRAAAATMEILRHYWLCCRLRHTPMTALPVA